MLVKEAFGKSVKSKRLEKGLSQEELALRAGLDRTYVSGIERGIRNPSLVNIRKIASALQCSISEIVLHMESEYEDKS